MEQNNQAGAQDQNNQLNVEGQNNQLNFEPPTQSVGLLDHLLIPGPLVVSDSAIATWNAARQTAQFRTQHGGSVLAARTYSYHRGRPVLVDVNGVAERGGTRGDREVPRKRLEGVG
ncbi:hypothetical protein DEU56DRAFT_756298 [Suillus clintonianus]|uniref:uncharacterized protein n=1 Tax=Suillus clintonianus TaxID=1904413 RepID=UPI001B85C807|nr:uncharacterized protein DEU56DRAFT_756298 [Suillus clintonianus]KAG2136739.1 hypothetical protein DEU56DRAFT_756298 [Suillus clintonianus]